MNVDQVVNQLFVETHCLKVQMQYTTKLTPRCNRNLQHSVGWEIINNDDSHKIMHYALYQHPSECDQEDIEA